MRIIDLEADDAAQASFRSKRSPLQIQEIIANDPVVATRCFHTLVVFVINVLLNCSLDPAKLHPDGIASGSMPGVFGFISSFCGVVEPQMRKALHLHSLIGDLGFSTPEDLRAKLTLDFDSVCRRLWQWITSLYCTSPEAYAAFLHEESAMEALRTAPLVPIKSAQRKPGDKRRSQLEMIGPKRAAESVQAQLRARGMKQECAKEDLEPSKFRPWQPEFYGDRSLSSSDWAREASVDNLAATISVGNHECIPEVCHKGRIGQQGFCRMMYWFWAWVRKSGKHKWRRYHGKRLVPRWDPTTKEQPPIDCVPPHVGKAQTEQTQPYVTKSNGTMYGGPRCNHDVGVLPRCPIDIHQQDRTAYVAPDADAEEVGELDGAAPAHASAMNASGATVAVAGRDEEDQKEKDARIERALGDLASAVNDADFYCSEYNTKEQPRLTSLWHGLASSFKNLKEELRDVQLDSRYKDVLYRAKRSVFRLMTSCTHGMQKGMPEMVSYLLGKPEFYCSHAFSSLYLYPLVHLAHAELLRRAPKATSSEISAADGAETFSFVRTEEDDKLTFLNQRLSYEFRPHAFGGWPLYFFVAGTMTHKRTQNVKAEIFDAFLPGHPQAKSHYVTARQNIPWVVPEIIGSLPPRQEDDPFSHALILLLLFKPWRSIAELLGDCGQKQDVVELYAKTRSRWQAVVDGLGGRRPADVPSEEAFAYRALRHISNFEMMSLKRNEESIATCSKAPPTLDDVDFPEDMSSSESLQAEDAYAQCGREDDNSQSDDEGMSDAEEQEHHTQRATFPPLIAHLPCVWPP